jgi:hypothetical protein
MPLACGGVGREDDLTAAGLAPAVTRYGYGTIERHRPRALPSLLSCADCHRTRTRTKGAIFSWTKGLMQEQEDFFDNERDQNHTMWAIT